MSIDRQALAAAFDQLKSCSFPGHPDHPDLAEWVLELSEIDGHLAGLAVTALGSSRVQAASLHDATDHGRRLSEISVVGDDERIYDDCLAYAQALQRVEDALSGQPSRSG